MFGVKARDPIVFVSVPLMLMVVALLSIWFPAARASRVNPVESLRYEYPGFVLLDLKIFLFGWGLAFSLSPGFARRQRVTVERNPPHFTTILKCTTTTAGSPIGTPRSSRCL